MKKKIIKIIDYIRNIGRIDAEYRKYSADEVQYFEAKKIEANITRIQLVSLIIIIIQFMHFVRRMMMGINQLEDRLYVIAEIAMIVIICVHEIIYDIWLKQGKKYTILSKQYIFSWILCFSGVTIAFMFLDSIFKQTYDNFYILIAVISIVPLVGIKTHLFFTLFLTTSQCALLALQHVKVSNYKMAIIYAWAFFLIGRMVYVYYIRNCVVNLRLANVEKELEIQTNRIQVLQELTKETSFEYNFKEDKMLILDGGMGETRILYNYMDKLKHHYYSILDEEVPRFTEIYREIIYGKKRETFEFRFKDKNGTIQKSKALFTTIYEGEHPSRLIGKVYKVDTELSDTDDKNQQFNTSQQ